MINVCKCVVKGKPHEGGKDVSGKGGKDVKEVPRFQDFVTEQKVTLPMGRPGNCSG